MLGEHDFKAALRTIEWPDVRNALDKLGPADETQCPERVLKRGFGQVIRQHHGLFGARYRFVVDRVAIGILIRELQDEIADIGVDVESNLLTLNTSDAIVIGQCLEQGCYGAFLLGQNLGLQYADIVLTAAALDDGHSAESMNEFLDSVRIGIGQILCQPVLRELGIHQYRVIGLAAGG